MPDSIFAVFADVHANLEALQAVLADMDARAISQRICLGDVVGYAANPVECLQLIRGLGCPVIQGNHDQASGTDMALDDFSDGARLGIEFTRPKLSPEQRAYLAGLPLTFSSGHCQFVHASLNDPGAWHYIMREAEAREHFQVQADPLCFGGHTHAPIVWHLSNTGNIKCWRGKGRIDLPPGGKILVNVGSVGQPRDLCPDACYVVGDLQAGWVEFRRVAYDIPKARRKIVRANLPPHAAERLSRGE